MSRSDTLVKHKLQIAREAEGLSVADLAVLSDVSTATIYNIENLYHEAQTKEAVADLLAEALYLRVCDLFSSAELTTRGRPPCTGSPMGAQMLDTECHSVCPDCHMLLPASGECNDCN